MNILYGVPGEGMGHATRSKVVIDFLLNQKHNVQIVSSAKAFKFLSAQFPGRVHEIKGFHLAYKNANVSKSRTAWLLLKSAPKNLIHNFSQYLSINKNFHPDLVISDFESFSYFYAKYKGLPIISIDNMQVINRCEIDIAIPKTEKQNYLLAKNIVKSKLPGCEKYFITSFFDAQPSKQNTVLVPPIVRKEIINAKTSVSNHILIYQSSSSFGGIKEILQALPEEAFYVYGFNREETDKNIRFKAFSEQGFIADLASAKAVICNGGFSFISEAVYLKKPIYSFPIQNQFEQYLNAAYVEKMNYGRHFETLSADNIKAFLYELDKFRQSMNAYSQNGNDMIFDLLKKVLAGYQ